ncbi:hypothetical protein [uncultured Parvimonas sp.]|nr:hypothetical protein [uncultured Parvimonas sp.]
MEIKDLEMLEEVENSKEETIKLENIFEFNHSGASGTSWMTWN